MIEVQVRNCTVRVVRRGGWSWGSDPGRLLDDVLAAVPTLLADALASAVPEGADAEVRDPVRVAVTLRRSDLAALARAGSRGAGVPARDPGGPAAALALAVEGALAERGVTRGRPAAGREPTARAVAVPVRPAGPATLRLLLAWSRDGVLADLLERLPEPVLAAWHEALVAGWRAPPAAAAGGAEVAGALAEVAADWTAGPVADRVVWLRRRLAALTLVAASTGLAPCQPQVLAALEERLGPAPPLRPRPAAAAAAPSPERGAGPPLRLGGRPDRPAVVPAAAPPGVAGPAREASIGSALPFLLLGPLARSGWLDTLAVAVEAAELGEHWPSLAAGLAFKVLSPPGHGWRRSDEDQATAAAFAGADVPLVEGALPAAAGLLAPALDAVLACSLVDGHRPGAPLVLVEAGAGAGVVLFDADGLFPMAWADDAAGLAGWLRGCLDAPLLRGPAARHGPQGPGEPGEHGGPGGGDLDLLDRADRVVAELRRRPALPLAAEPTLERSLTLAAGAGLATIAQALWGGREPTDPLLAIERLASLSAVVRGDAERVRVIVPLGARHRDLQRNGMLGEVPEVPWLGGRSVEIVGG